MDSTRRRARVIAIGNQKGGTGKSTVTVHLAAALGRRRKRVLVIDLDPAAGATKHLGVSPDGYAGTFELLTSEEALDALVLTSCLPIGVNLIAARPQLSELDQSLSRYTDRTRLLARAIAEGEGTYDYILLDTAPYAAFVTTVAAYAAAEWFLLTAFPHPLSLAGLTEAFRDLADVRRLTNPGLRVLGVVMTNVDRRASRMLAEIEHTLEAAAPGSLMRSRISQAAVIPWASGHGHTVFEIDNPRRERSVAEFLALADEVEDRIGVGVAAEVGEHVAASSDDAGTDQPLRTEV